MKQVKTKEACRMIGLTQSRFNEIAHKGHYPCLPVTTAGAARLFNVDDVAVLWAYKILTEHDVRSSVAGKICCQIRDAIKEDTVSAHVYLQRGGESSVELNNGHVEANRLDDGITRSFHLMHRPVSIVLNIQQLRDAVSRQGEFGLEAED